MLLFSIPIKFPNANILIKVMSTLSIVNRDHDECIKCRYSRIFMCLKYKIYKYAVCIILMYIRKYVFIDLTNIIYCLLPITYIKIDFCLFSYEISQIEHSVNSKYYSYPSHLSNTN